jgi:hypothetical protein
MGWLTGGPAKMAATNKCLADSNKSRTGFSSTNKCLAESNKSPDGPGAWEAHYDIKVR